MAECVNLIALFTGWEGLYWQDPCTDKIDLYDLDIKVNNGRCQLFDVCFINFGIINSIVFN